MVSFELGEELRKMFFRLSSWIVPFRLAHDHDATQPECAHLLSSENENIKNGGASRDISFPVRLANCFWKTTAHSVHSGR